MSFKDEDDRRQLLDREVHKRGRAKIKLSNLKFESISTPGERPLDPKNVERLRKIFREEGCLRLDPRHYIPAIITEDLLERSLRSSGMSQSSLMAPGEPHFLELEDAVLCLYGKHRVEAAKFSLDPFDKWWIVDLYIPGLNETTIQEIKEEYTNAANFSHGDIYRNIRYNQMSNRTTEARKWLVRLSPTLQADLSRFWNNDLYRTMRSTLDELIDYSGLWPALQLGCLRRLFSLKCVEEYTNYCAWILSTWRFILGNNVRYHLLLDYATVEAIQQRAPGRCGIDHEYLMIEMKNRKLFPLILDPAQRESILDRLLTLKSQVPSIYTFLEDTKWLEPPIEALKKMISPGRNSTFQRAMLDSFELKSSIKLQLSDGFRRFKASDKGVFFLAYLSVFTFAWRHFPLLGSLKPRREKSYDPTTFNNHNAVLENLLQRHAIDLGFKILRPDQSPEKTMVKRFLNDARPPDLFEATINHEDIIYGILRYLSSFKESSSLESAAIVSRQPLTHRSGRPYESSFNAARTYFWVDQIYGDTIHENDSFLTHRDIFRAFFGQSLPDATMIEEPQITQQTPIPPDTQAMVPYDFDDEESPPTMEVETGDTEPRGLEQPANAEVTHSRRARSPSMEDSDTNETIKIFLADTEDIETWSKDQVPQRMSQMEAMYLFARRSGKGLKYITNSEVVLSNPLEALFVIKKKTNKSTNDDETIVMNWERISGKKHKLQSPSPSNDSEL